ncbi:SDR family oxidoreductase [Cryomorphaceae bacterium]|nr:SDR family oxidoreductase [Cryomorphaceae bacterium]
MKTALVTGARKGLGFEWCRQLGQKGYRIALTARRKEQAKEAAEILANEGIDVLPYGVDVTSEKELQELARQVQEDFGHLDVLINNAGINSKSRAGEDRELLLKNVALDQLAKEELLNMLDVNALSPILVGRALRPLLARSKEAKVIQIGSWLGSISIKRNGGNYSYAVSKSALNMMNRAFAFDVIEDGIVSVVVNPGWVQTDMGGQKATFTPKESVTSVIEHVLERVGDQDAGEFFNFDGEIHPW